MVEEVIYNKLLEFIEEDMPFGDLTTNILIPESTTVKARIVAKQKGIVACIEEVVYFMRKLGLEVDPRVRDGEEVDRGKTVIEVVGPARTILSIERVVLNLLMHCSGIATEVRKLVELVRRVNNRVKIAATRKTLPGLRYFEKKAVQVGGGDAHRYSLSDAVLIKDNHISIIGNLEEAIKTARSKTSFIHKIEVEVSTVEDAIKAVEYGVDVVMLDNMKPEEVARVIEELRKRGLRDRVLIEVSGGITPDNILEYAKLDVDVISCGYITMSSRHIDMSLDIVEVVKK